MCADHPSNEFFNSFPNCLIYRAPEDFKETLECEPHPLTPEQRCKLSWEAATQRFMEYSDLDQILSELANGGLAFAHYCLIGNELPRLCTGAKPGTRDYDKQHCKVLKFR